MLINSVQTLDQSVGLYLIAKEASNKGINPLALSTFTHHYSFHMYGKQLELNLITFEEIANHSDGQESLLCMKPPTRCKSIIWHTAATYL